MQRCTEWPCDDLLLSLDPNQMMTIDRIHLQRALNAAQLGSWHCDPTRSVFSWDQRSKEIIGTLENETTVEEFMTWVHPDDVALVWAAYRAALDPAEPRRSA